MTAPSRGSKEIVMNLANYDVNQSLSVSRFLLGKLVIISDTNMPEKGHFRGAPTLFVLTLVVFSD